MHLEDIPLKHLSSHYPPLFFDYIQQKNSLHHLVPNSFPIPENIKKISQQRSEQITSQQREELYLGLKRQYQGFSLSPSVQENLDSLRDSQTLSLCTGQQLHPFLGPLYVLYKILSLLSLRKQVQQLLPEYRFVPIFWMASEDHDVDEIRSWNLLGRHYVWPISTQGPTGDLSTQGLSELMDRFPEPCPEIFVQAYTTQEDLASATRYLLTKLFEEDGLLVLDPREKRWKDSFFPFFQDDIEDQIVEKTTKKGGERLVERGYQTPILPMSTNTFRMGKGYRKRIEKLSAQDSPEKLSPNVFLRTLYQEHILPNIAYIGGPSEIAYWLQAQPLFEHYDKSLPILFPRYIGGILPKRWIPHPAHLLFQENSPSFFSVQPYEKDWTKLLSRLESDAKTDSAKSFFKRETRKMEKQWKTLLNGLQKEQEKQGQHSLRIHRKARQKLFPKPLFLQERYESSLGVYLNYPEAIPYLQKHINPFSFSKFHLLGV
ncbi:MAG: bacillithiol biosynthesis BshC [Cytophagales bacterium]|nr:bacillithiol biosynthesis BshC [Cytophagales bacterium]